MRYLPSLIALLLFLLLSSLSFIINYYVDMTVPIESIPGLILMITQYRHNEIFTKVTVFMNIFLLFTIHM